MGGSHHPGWPEGGDGIGLLSVLNPLRSTETKAALTAEPRETSSARHDFDPTRNPGWTRRRRWLNITPDDSLIARHPGLGRLSMSPVIRQWAACPLPPITLGSRRIVPQTASQIDHPMVDPIGHRIGRVRLRQLPCAGAAKMIARRLGIVQSRRARLSWGVGFVPSLMLRRSPCREMDRLRAPPLLFPRSPVGASPRATQKRPDVLPSR